MINYLAIQPLVVGLNFIAPPFFFIPSLYTSLRLRATFEGIAILFKFLIVKHQKLNILLKKSAFRNIWQMDIEHLSNYPSNVTKHFKSSVTSSEGFENIFSF